MVTGMGAVSALGIGCEKIYNNLLDGVSGVDYIQQYDASEQQTKIAAEVRDFDPTQFFPKKQIRRIGRYTQFALIAAREAIEQSGLDMERENKDRIATLIASAIGDFPMIEEQVKVYYEEGPGKMSPFTVPRSSSNMAGASVTLEYGLTGPSFGFSSACATSSHSIASAALLLESGLADVVITGGTESAIAATFMESYIALKAMSTRNDEPQKASRPFDKDRDGFVMGEGAAVMVLETLEHARKRNAVILAELVGYGMSSDAFHVTAAHPEGRGAVNAITNALKMARMNPEEIDYINAHGTGTPINDPVETIAIKKVFADHAHKIPISSNKSMFGHCIGAAGALEAMASIMTLLNNKIPPTINLDNPDPLCDLDYVPHVAREQKVDAVMSNSFGFGGQNGVLIFRKFTG